MLTIEYQALFDSIINKHIKDKETIIHYIGKKYLYCF